MVIDDKKLEEEMENLLADIRNSSIEQVHSEAKSLKFQAFCSYLTFSSSKELNRKIMIQQRIIIVATVALAIFAGVQILLGFSCDWGSK